jgi:hypothetical protein
MLRQVDDEGNGCAYLFRAVQLCLGLGLGVVEFLPGFGLQLLVVIYHIFFCLATGLAGNTTGVFLPDGFQSRILLLDLWPVRLRWYVC